jgi:general secretion pathway protein C
MGLMWTQFSLQLFFRKYFWTVHLLFILLVAFLAARTVNLFVEAAILPLPTADVPRTSTRPRVTETTPPLNLERIAKLTGLPVPKEIDVVEPPDPVADLNSAPVKSSLHVKLLGTLYATRPEFSIASILDVGTQHAETYMLGDKIQGAEILEIERERVIIFSSRRREFINGDAGDGAQVTSVSHNPAPNPGVTGSGIKALSENEYEVPRSEIDKTLSNLNDIAMQARIVPAFKDGQAQGFKLFSIRPDSLYTKIGIRNGDVIEKINGYELNSPEKALEIYTKLKEASRIDIEFERNGTKNHKTYTIR